MNASKIILGTMLLTTGMNALSGTIEMKVNGLVCGFCAQGIEKALRKNPATADVLVSLENRLVALSTKEGTDIPDEQLTQALTNAGYDVKSIERTSNSLDALRARLKESR